MITMRTGTKKRIRLIVILVVSSIATMLAGHFGYLKRVELAITTVTTPIYSFIDKPFHWWHSFLVTSSEHQQLMERNAQLRATVMLLREKLQRVQSLKSENERLMALLRSSTYVEGKVVAASVMSVSLDPFRQQVLIDKGKEQDVNIGQPVLDAYGVFGQVIKVMTKQSVVALLSDEQQAIPVELARNHIRGIVVGNGVHEPMRMLHITSTDDIAVGDAVVSSGLTGRFPPGYPVGVVESIAHGLHRQFMEVMITPSAHFRQSKQVLLVWSDRRVAKKMATKDKAG